VAAVGTAAEPDVESATAMLAGPLSFRLRAACSRKATSSCQCKVSSITQRARKVASGFSGVSSQEQRDDPRLRSSVAALVPGRLAPAEGPYPVEIMTSRQPLGRREQRFSCLQSAVSRAFGDGRAVTLLHRAEPAPGFGQDRVLVGLGRQAAVAGVDRRNRTAVAMERSGGRQFAFERGQFKIARRDRDARWPASGPTLPRRPERCLRSRVLALVDGVQGPAIDCDRTALPQEPHYIGLHPAEGVIKRLRTDDPEHGRECFVRRGRMSDTRNGSERSPRPAKGVHLGTECYAAVLQLNGDTEQLAKDMTSVPSGRIVDAFETEQQQMHGGEGHRGMHPSHVQWAGHDRSSHMPFPLPSARLDAFESLPTAMPKNYHHTGLSSLQF